MNYLELNNDTISLCEKDTCIHAKGQNAKLIAMGAFAMLLMIGVSALIKSN